MSAKDLVVLEEWVIKFHQGDAIAFKLFYDATFHSAFAYLGKFELYKDHCAEDVLNEGYCRIFTNRHKYENFDHATRTLMVMIKHLAIDVKKKERAEKNFKRSLLSSDASTEMAASEHIEQLLRYKHIRAAVKKLPKRMRMVVLDLIYQEKSTIEVAEKMGITTQTVLNLKTKAIYNLSNYLMQGSYDRH